MDTEKSTKRNYYGKYKNYRLLSVLDTLKREGESPAENLIRIARIAENQGDLRTASKNWLEILSYVEAKRKPIDPVEQKKMEKQIATLEEIQKLKAAVLAGATEIIHESTVIEGELIPIENNSLSEFV